MCAAAPRRAPLPHPRHPLRWAWILGVLAVLLLASAITYVGPHAAPGTAATSTPLAPHHRSPSTSSNGSLSDWVELNGSGGPAGRSAPAFAFDPILNASILFGGYSPTTGALGDTWELKNGTWFNLTANLSTAPPARWEPSFAYDPAIQRFVLFGGRNDTQFLNDTWTFNVSGWSPFDTYLAPSPSARSSSFAYLPSASALFLYGGGMKNINTGQWVYFNDTWEFTARGWANLTAIVGTPPPDGTNIVAGGPDGPVLVFGGATVASGCNPLAFEWTFQNGTWTNQTANAANGPGGTNGIFAAGATYDTALNAALFFGGVTGTPAGGCYSTAQTWMYTNGTWTDLSSLLGPTPVSRQSFVMTYDSVTGEAILFGGNTFNTGTYLNDTWEFLPNLWPAGPSYSVRLPETGLPVNTSWSVDWSGFTATTSTSQVEVTVPNGSYSFSISAPAGYRVSPTAGMITIDGANYTTPVVFTLIGPNYTVNLTESGLPSGADWTSNLSGSVRTSTTNTTTFLEPNGTYALAVVPVAGYSVSYPPQVVVNGSSVAPVVLFHPGNLTFYPLTFAETGLPNGTTWGGNFTQGVGVNAFSVPGASGTFHEPNGTYQLAIDPQVGYAASFPASFTISGAAATVNGTFTPQRGTTSYSVTVTESGLPNGTIWGASLGGVSHATASRTIVDTEVNGSYVLTVSAPANYTANYTSPVVVNGSAVTVAIAFSATTYPVTFLETGLPSGSLWTVTATNTVTHTVTSGDSTGTTLTLHLADGTYTVQATSPTGYRGSLLPATFSVVGRSPASLQATFVTTSPSGVAPASLPWLTLGVLVITGLAAILGAGWGYRRYQYARRRELAQHWLRTFQGEEGDTDGRPPK
jgi:hypothetical protein